MYRILFYTFICSLIAVILPFGTVSLRPAMAAAQATEYRSIPTIEPAVIYTFVGITSPTANDDVLARLSRQNIRATFFVFEREMQRNAAELRKIIAAGHEIGLAIRPAEGDSVENIRQQIRQAAASLEAGFGIKAQFVKQPFGTVPDTVKEAAAAEGLPLIGHTVNVVQSRHKECRTADEVMPEIFGKLVYSMGRGQIVNFRMDFYTNPYLCGELVDVIKQKKIDNIAYNYYDDIPGVDGGNDSAYTVKCVGDVYNNASMRWEYPVSMTAVPERLRPDYRSFSYDGENFQSQLLKRYIGAPYIDAQDRTLGFKPRELRRLDTEGFIHTDDNVIFLTFDDWGYDAAINKLMYVLRKHHVKGTFFIITRSVQNNPNLLRALAAEGHEIGSHTENHQPMVVRNERNKLVAVQSPEEYDEDVKTSYRKLVEITGDVVVDGRSSLTRFFRPPTLAISRFGMDKIFGNGYEYVVSGSCSTEDYAAASLSELVKTIQSGLYGADGRLNKGAVFVMHMSDASPYTARALDLVLTANEQLPDGDPLKFKVGLLADYLDGTYEQTPPK